MKTLTLGILFLVSTTAIRCKEANPDKGKNGTQKTNLTEIDIHTAVLKNDIEAIKQHITKKSDLNVKESIGGAHH